MGTDRITVKLRIEPAFVGQVRGYLAERVRLKFTERWRLLWTTFEISGPAEAVEAAKLYAEELKSASDERMQIW